MSFPKTYFWQKAPFVRLLAALVAAILAQWYLQLPVYVWAILFVFIVACLFAFRFLPINKQFAYSTWRGTFILFLVGCFAALLTWKNDIRNNRDWIGNLNANNATFIVSIEEPLVEKPASYKAVGSIRSVITNGRRANATGKLLLYFKKDSATKNLGYGGQIIFKKQIQEIKNSGNPGGFDFKQYSLFNGITHQVYLVEKDYLLLSQKQEKWYQKIIFESRQAIVNILRRFIRGEKEQGLAEALLIGYKDDLDKRLVQSYSNTGVVHVIAISGLHLGMIYGLLLAITVPLKNFRWWRFLIVVTGLWSFSLLAGAQPSILRSAVMFSAIALSTAIDRQSSIFNTLALSAFALLCWNPYWLWDVGFQLSYSAVLSIIIFFRPIYNWIYFPNKLIDLVWKLMAVTLAAQILTLPFVIYHFHQFPFVFLFANLVAVPLSSFILLLEIALCILSFFTPLASLLGNFSSYLISFLNGYIERLDLVSFATWNGLSITVIQAAVLLVMISAMAIWLLEKQKKALTLAVISFFAFSLLRSFSFQTANQQQKLIVYNVPKLQAVDLIEGRNVVFIGDSVLQYDDYLRNFHIQPSRNLHRLRQPMQSNATQLFSFMNKTILVVDKTLSLKPYRKKIDLLILSRNPKIYIKELVRNLQIAQVVCDGSVPAWKAALWRKDCNALRIPFHYVAENGAFVMQR